MLIHVFHEWRGTQGPLSGVPKAAPRFDDSLGDLTGLCIESAICTAVIYCIRKIQSKISKGRRCLVRSLESTRSKVPESPPRRVAREALKSPSIELWQCVSNVDDQRSLLEIQFPGSLLGAVHRGTFCLAGTQIPDPQKKANIQRKPRCVYKQLRHSVCTPQLTEVKLSPNPGSWTPAKGQPCKLGFQIQHPGLLYELFTAHWP